MTMANQIGDLIQNLSIRVQRDKHPGFSRISDGKSARALYDLRLRIGTEQ
jgi:hypothetical protein